VRALPAAGDPGRGGSAPGDRGGGRTSASPGGTRRRGRGGRSDVRSGLGPVEAA
jgi:hypothetical protein